jgi:hypothetical protein
MNTDVDMTYSFLWDEEPTDEQLQALMQEVSTMMTPLLARLCRCQ